MMTNDLITELAIKTGFYKVSCIVSSEIIFDEQLRLYCAQNRCGQYNKNYACPPYLPSVEHYKQKLSCYRNCVVLQTKASIEDEFDWDSINAAQKVHQRCLNNFEKLLKKQGMHDICVHGAGPCDVCKKCACIDNLSCRAPKQKKVSLEACGIDVTLLAKSAGLSCNHGKNTVTFLAAVFY